MFSSTMRFRPLLLGVLGGGFVLCACTPDTPATPPAKPEPRPAAVAPVPPPAPPQPVLSRADMIAALEEETSRYAAGGEAVPSTLVGRRFQVRQAFGCLGTRQGEAVDGIASWAWTKDGKGIELTLRPGDWKASGLLGADAEALEAAEGVWLTWPWLRTGGCPATRDDAGASPSPSPQTAGFVAMYGKGESRLGGRRDGKAYTYRVRGEGGDPPPLPVGGYVLVLEGRLGAFADGQPIRCAGEGADKRPICVVAVRLDRVAFEAADGTVLSEWRGG